ncbi:MAG: hypothetical protein GEV10_05120 [Streptosporangiales bacterium]|nr:hypothetical protein [Streptosporangiales bacterium]
MAWKKIAGAGLAASAGVALLFAAVNPAQAASSNPDSAYGVHVQLSGNDVIKKTPFVESTDGKLVKERTASIPARDWQPTVALPIIGDDAPMDVGALEVLAEKNHAEARIGNLNLGGDAGITAELIEATSENAVGSSKIVGLKIGNNDLSGLAPSPAANTTIGVAGLLEITLNEQITNDDGSLTVNAVHVKVAPGITAPQLDQLLGQLSATGGLDASAGLTQLSELDGLSASVTGALEGLTGSSARSADPLASIVLASATSGDNGDDGGDDPGDDDDDNGDDDGGDDDGSAPTPTPVQTEHAVTG